MLSVVSSTDDVVDDSLALALIPAEADDDLDQAHVQACYDIDGGPGGAGAAASASPALPDAAASSPVAVSPPQPTPRQPSHGEVTVGPSANTSLLSDVGGPDRTVGNPDRSGPARAPATIPDWSQSSNSPVPQRTQVRL